MEVQAVHVRLFIALVSLTAASGCSGDRMRAGETPVEYAVRLAADHDAAFVAQELRALEGENVLSEEAVLEAGSFLLMTGEIQTAYVIQQLSVELFPASSRASVCSS